MEELEGNVLAVAHALATQLATPAEPPTEAMAKPGGIQLTNKRVLRKFEGSIGESGKAARARGLVKGYNSTAPNNYPPQI